ncbi:hypothetical protein [Solimonas flava]|uniref:hypothetical protein n=1 Tax=Solimonas flava TaxID=415849 RepID=UPI0003F99165|nr:hypothetical protein [Solimonas flava]
MIRKGQAEAEAGTKRRRRRAAEPLDVQLTVRFNFGAAPDDHVTVINNRRVPMVGSVIANRDRILRGFVSLLIRTAMKQPRIARELFPLLTLPVRRRKPEDARG